MSTKRKNISKEMLEELYINRNLTMKEICKELGISQPITVAKYMKIHGIQVRNVNFERSLLNKLNLSDDDFKKELYRLYIGKQMSQIELADMYGVSHNIISRYLIKYKIPVRNNQEAKAISNTGSNSGTWKGGRVITKDGYVLVYDPSHPRPIRRNYVYEHRLMMEKHLGRILDKKEHVHHLNGNKLDNRIENLQLLSSSEHAKMHSSAEKARKMRESKRATTKA